MTAFLIVAFIANPLSGLFYLFSGSTITNLPQWTIPVMGLFSFANFVFALAIWKWKKWGAYGFAASALAAFVINVLYVGIGGAVMGLLGAAILAFLLRDVWAQME